MAVAWAIRYEMARTIDDVLAKKSTVIVLRCLCAAVASCEKVAKLLQRN
jgi:glycerol-3-phosphate dehydrogenase